MPTKNSKVTGIRIIPAENYDRLLVRAKRKRITVNALVNLAIKEILRSHTKVRTTRY